MYTRAVGTLQREHVGEEVGMAAAEANGGNGSLIAIVNDDGSWHLYLQKM